MTSKGLSKALRHGGSSVTATLRGAASQQRSFSSSRANHQKGVPVLSDAASTPELTALLSSIRKTIFLPAHLSEQRKRLIYSSKNAKTLQDDPLKVDINGEEFRLQFIDRTKDIHGTRKAINGVLHLFKDKRDWDNLPNLLEGFSDAHRRPKDSDFERIIRRAGMAGRSDVIVECLRRSKKTKLSLDQPGQVNQLLFWIQHEAAVSGWTEVKSKKALRLAEEVLKAITYSQSSQEEHTFITSTLLQLAAVVARIQGSDIGDKAKVYADRLLDVTAADPGLEKLLPLDLDANGRNRWLCAAIPVVHAWTSAAKVLSPNAEFTTRAAELRTRVDSQYQASIQAGGENSLGVRTYNLLLQAEN